MTSACSAFMPTAVLVLPTLKVWRCKNPGCRPNWLPNRIILELEYDGRSIMRHKCACNTWNRLPDDIDNLRMEQRR